MLTHSTGRLLSLSLSLLLVLLLNIIIIIIIFNNNTNNSDNDSDSDSNRLKFAFVVVLWFLRQFQTGRVLNLNKKIFVLHIKVSTKMLGFFIK